jgi:glycosyltransferase involved in cell wall biosynthesis
MARPIKVLMVTGAYHPEISSGGLQSELMIRAMQGRAEVRVLTTAIDLTTPRRSMVDGVDVTRVHLRVDSVVSKIRAAMVMVTSLFRLVPWSDVIHVHGVSTKNVFVTAIAKLFRRPVVLSLHTMGADEPGPIRQTGPLAWWSFTSASRYLAVSPALLQASVGAGIAANRIEHVPNGIETDRFRPASPAERRELRRAVGHDVSEPVILFVGYFSHDKQPRVMFDAWLRLFDEHGLDTTAWFVGATKSDYFEVDERIADEMQSEAERRGRADRLIFTGPLHEVDRHFRLADVFVLPSRREGLPVALMEAMSCGLPCVASLLPGATDTLIVDGVSGRLVAAGDVGAFSIAIADMLRDPVRAGTMGAAARQVVLDRFASEKIAECWLRAYRLSIGPGNPGPPAAG